MTGTGETTVLVVGAGPTGLTVANELARHGVAVRIIDRAPVPATTSRALVVQSRTMEIFEDMGIVEDAVAVGVPARSLNVMFAGGRSVRLDFAELLTEARNYTAYQTPYSISQDDTERLLTKALAQRGVRIERGLAVTDLSADESGVTVSVHRTDGANGSTQDGDKNAAEVIRCGWLIGCDGAHSAVRAAAGIPFEGATYPDEFIMADAELEWDLPDGDLYVFPNRAGLFAAFAMPGEHRFRIFGNVRPGPEGPSAEYSEPTHDEFQAMMDERLPFAATVVKEHWVSRYRLHRRTVPRYRDGRVFLVGDAAHVHSPAGAQGMNTGIQDAYNLAWKLALVLRGAAEESLLDSYHAERHPFGVKLLKTTDRMFTVISGQGRLAKFIRAHFAPQIASRVLTRRSFRAWFVGMLSQLRVSYPDSPLNRQEGARWGAAAAPGERAPDADMIIDGHSARLHDVLHGTRHTVLLFTGWDAQARPAVELNRLAKRIEHDYPDLVTARVVSAERYIDHPATIGDQDRTVHRQYGIDRASAFVIRPDLHIGYRGHPIDTEAIMADLAHRLPGGMDTSGRVAARWPGRGR